MAYLDERFRMINYSHSVSLYDAIIVGKRYRITILSDILVRLEYSAEGKFEDRPTEQILYRNFSVPRFTKQEDSNFLVLATKYFKLEYQKEMPFIGSKASPDQYLKITLNNSDKTWFFGAAEARNFKGSAYSLDNADGDANYQKGLYSTDGFVSIDDSKSLILNEDGSYTQRTDNRIDTYVFLYRKDFGFCLRDYYKLTGKPALIPRYALGIWWYKDLEYKTEDIKNLVENFKLNEIPLSIFLLGNNWHLKHDNLNNGFTFNYNLIENPKNLMDYLHKNNIRIGLNVNPLIGIHPDEIAYSRFKEAVNYQDDNNNKTGIIPFNIFNQDMVMAYFNEFIKPLVDMGTDFFWIDYNNEKDLSSLRALNRYHFLNYSDELNKRPMILSRNGMLSSHRYPVLYSGETIVSWKNLNMIPEFNSKSSNIGLSWWSHDIGGYKSGIEDSELYMRFVQLGTYSPIFRFSSASSHYYKREPWLWDVKTFSVVREYLKLRHRLIPYIYNEGYKYSKTGLPLIQPIYYRYPEIYDEPLYKNEYYFGTELFIAPITNKKDLLMNRTIHRIFLPNGVWYDFKTGKKYIGGKRYVTFFKDEDYPVFAKRGTIIPLAVLHENDLNNTSIPKTLDIHIFPGASNIYKLYEDDGTSSLYESGYYTINDIDYNYQTNNFTCIIRQTEGKNDILPERRNYIVRFRNTRTPSEVSVYVGDEKVDYFKAYSSVNDFIVEIENAPTSLQLSINCRGNNIEIDAERIINDDIDSILSDLQISTDLKTQIAEILFANDIDIKKKRILVRKLKRKGLHPKYVTMFLKLLEYIAEL